ncbi:hypothetical protein [Cyanobacterium sp. uoEpiScrs1]|uniref:hypothetical protein n=1 Tax=Cyanobacterium sp. uoEpiScrs1 TaxID=2976343 RepID=UPI00226AC68E|nr:hypothetical protein [Cyanobacterium sp. uoEpiScrs1]
MMRQTLMGLLITVGCLGKPSGVYSQNTPQLTSCPSDLQKLTELMLKDLPSYTNRVIQRKGLKDRPFSPSLYVLVIGKPEFEPLPLTNLQYQPVLKDTAQQVFFTTLERQYGEESQVTLENYYWLFLAQTEKGWRAVMLFSQLASLNDGGLPLPPKDASNGPIGQGIRLWLRDCRAGVIKLND